MIHACQKEKEVSKHMKKGIGNKNHNTAPVLGQISPDLSVYQNPISGSYINPFWHHRTLWLTDPQFPHCLTALQLILPSQSLITKELTHPQKGNFLSLLSFLNLVTGSGSSLISIGDSLVPMSMSIGFLGVPGMGTGGGDGDGRGERIGKGSGETCRARPLWFF